MKRIMFIIAVLICTTAMYSQTRCISCNGYGRFRCNNCSGYGFVYQQVYNPYFGIYQTVTSRCVGCGGYGVIVCLNCNGLGYTRSSSPSFGSQTKWFVKTTYKCSTCNGCSGYWGIYHTNETYEGACSNTDGYGYRCGHGPEKHGLKKW